MTFLLAVSGCYFHLALGSPSQETSRNEVDFQVYGEKVRYAGEGAGAPQSQEVPPLLADGEAAPTLCTNHIPGITETDPCSLQSDFK